MNHLTIDVEEYFHVGRPGEGPAGRDLAGMPSRVEADVERTLALLRGPRVRATFFVLGEVARERPGLVARIAAAGHEVASHGFRHAPVDLMSLPEFGEDLDRAVAAIVDACGERPLGYRAPIWSLSRAPWREKGGIDALHARGFLYDSSLVPVPPLGTPDLPHGPAWLTCARGVLPELPPLTGRFGPWRFPLGFGLGLRFWPSAALVRRIRAENAAGRPAVLALHTWETDPDPPALRLPPSIAVAHALGVERVGRKVLDLVSALPFVPMRDSVFARSGAS